MATTYTAYWRHYSLSRSVRIAIEAPSDRAAKAAAWRALGDGYHGHEVVLSRDGEEIASRTIGQRRGWR